MLTKVVVRLHLCRVKMVANNCSRIWGSHIPTRSVSDNYEYEVS